MWTPLIAAHAVAASFALTMGAFQLLRRRKGGTLHKVIGRVWVAAMYVVIFTSFGIQTLNGGFSWLHALSVLTFVTVTIGLWAAVKGRIHAHKSFMQGSYFGILGAFAGVVAVPSRRIPQMAMFDLPSLIGWVSGIAIVSFAIIGVARLVIQKKRERLAYEDEMEQLAREAQMGLKKRYGTAYNGEYVSEKIIIASTATDDRDIVAMRLIAKFIEQVPASMIKHAILVARCSPTGAEKLEGMTLEHFQMHTALREACFADIVSEPISGFMTNMDQTRHMNTILLYAIQNVSDGWILAKIVEERGVMDFAEAIDLLKAVKESGTTPLAEGAL